MFKWIDKKTQLLTSKGLHGCPRRLRPPASELFCTQSSLGKIGKEEPWTLEIISYWSDKLSSILDYLTFDPQKKYFTNSAQKSGVICLSRPRIPARLRSPRVPSPRVPESPSPRVPESPSPHVPASPRPRVPASPSLRVPKSPSPTSHVPVPLLVRAEKNRMFMQITNARKNMRTAYFARKLNIPISHNLNFKLSCYLRDFCSRMISFCQRLCPA